MGHIFSWVSEEKEETSPSQILLTKLEKDLSLSIYEISLCIHKFRLSSEKNCNITYEGEQLLIYLVKPTTKEEKITQYDVNTHETALV